jgi:hypothetical protein
MWWAMPTIESMRTSSRRQHSLSGSRTIVGWVESVILPRIGDNQVLAKLDTGAETCSLHATGIELKGRFVSFTANGKRHRVRLKDTRQVKSSNGEETWRPVVDLVVDFDGRKKTVEFTLANRGNMKFPVLLGRNYLQDGYLVDAGFTHLVSRCAKQHGRKQR